MADQLTSRESILVGAITDGLKGLWPAPPQDKSMDTNGNQYRALQTELESNRTEFHDFRTDVNLRFSEFSTALKSIERTITGLVTTNSPGATDARSFGGMGTILGVAALILTVATAFGTVVKMNIDADVNYAQERTTTTEKHLTDDMAVLAAAVKTLQDTTIPRPELDSRIAFIREQQQTKADKGVIDQVVARIDGQISYIRGDIERMKGDIVTRRENESHWSDVQNRLNLLSDRVNLLASSTGGASLSDQLKSLQEQVTSLAQQKR